MDSKVLITGGSGLVGTQLSEELVQRGFQVAHLSRSRNKSSKYQIFYWDIGKKVIEEGAFENVKFVIHLAGAGVADKRWSTKRKQVLVSSRLDGANLIYTYLKSTKNSVEAFISASAIGIYGFDTGGIEQTEDRMQLGDDFLATLTKKWETAADQFKDLNIRVVKLRIGLVLSEKGGMMEKILPMARLGLSSAFGSGEQFMSWIHIKDLTEIFIAAVQKTELQGVYNAVSPIPVKNVDFLKTLAEAINKPYFLPNTPKFVLKMVLGELSSAITGGNKVSSKKIIDSDFRFQFADLKEALRDLT